MARAVGLGAASRYRSRGGTELGRFHSVGGGIHHTAYIGGQPEMRNWLPGDKAVDPIIHPTARIHAFVTVDAGCEAATRIGARSWLMAHVHCGHDVVIGEDVEIAPHCSIGGFVVIQDGVHVGQGAIFKPNVVVGYGATIGCGAVVTKDVPAGETWVGNPARRLIKGERRPWGLPRRAVLDDGASSLVAPRSPFGI